MSWSAEQQRLLGAMGYTLYQRAAPGPAAMPMAVTSARPALAPGSTPARLPASGGVEKLLTALQRTVPGRDVLALAGDVEALRRDPMKKRALWPQLRALRRAH